MEPIKGWHEIEEAGAFEKIELGGHICTIKQARCELTKSNTKMMVISFDFTGEDKQANYFADKFRADKKRGHDAKWRGTYYQGYGNDVSTPFFKAMINRISESNPGYQWSWDENSLVGKKFCGVFGREEYLNEKGESKFAIKCMEIKAMGDLNDVQIPVDRLLTKKPAPSGFTPQQAYNSSLSTDIRDEDLPFQ